MSELVKCPRCAHIANRFIGIKYDCALCANARTVPKHVAAAYRLISLDGWPLHNDTTQLLKDLNDE